MSAHPTLTHVVNPVGVDPDHPLWLTQQVTFAAMRRALHGLEDRVEVATVGYPEDATIIPPEFRRLPDLSTSALDVADFSNRRKLPFLGDILSTAAQHCSSDHLIYTNLDIIPGPDFYRFVFDKLASGEQAFTINRRTVAPVAEPLENLDALFSQHGAPHPGHDCFVFPRAWVDHFDLGRTVVGVPWIGFNLLLNLATVGDVTVLDGEFQTFHIGDDRTWMDEDDRPYRDFHTEVAVGVTERMFVRDRTLRSNPYIMSHVRLMEGQRADADFRPPETRAEPPVPKVFSISSGRAGSEYLQTLLASASKVKAFHEPQPTMSGRPLEQAMETGEPGPDLVAAKLATIESVCQSLPPGWTYAETNHMFIKTFADAAVNRWLDSTSVIHLRRNLVDVLASFMKLGYFSDLNKAWPHWMHRVPSGLSLIDTPASFETMDPMDRSIAYLLDIEALGADFALRHPDLTMVETSLEALQELEEVERVLDALGLVPTPRTLEVTGRRVNERSHVKRGFGLDVDRSECRLRLERFAEDIDIGAAQWWVERSLAEAP